MNRQEKEQLRDNFYKELSEESKLSVSDIRKMLKKEGYTSFDYLKKPRYRATVLARAGAWLRVKEALTADTKPSKCLIPNCEGTRVRGSSAFGWTCTEGGNRHYLAYTVAQATGQDPNDALITLTDLTGKAIERDEEARRIWLKSMKERGDTTTTEDTEKSSVARQE